jgi:alpha-beta hydrolase superfamily lysophospholipase
MPEFIDAHGITIVYDIHPAKTTPRAVVQFAHGYGEHAGRYEQLFDALTSHGYTVYADDHIGHGRTGSRQHGGDAAKLGRLVPGSVRTAVDALAQMSETIRAENPSVPLVLIAHSWGSFMAQILFNRHPDWYDAVVLSGTVLRQLGSGNLGDLNKRWAGPEATGMEWLSRDPKVVQAYIDDPLTTTVPMGKNFGLRAQLSMMGLPSRKLRPETPLLLMVGRDDPVGGPVSVHKLANAYKTRGKLTDVTTLVYPEDRHEIFNEPDQAEVRADLLAWLDARIPSRD